MGSEEPRLPPGYRLDRSDPDVWALRRPEGWVVAYFSARGAIKEAIEEAAWEDHKGSREEQYPWGRLVTISIITEAIGQTEADAASGSTRKMGALL
jgi:hypothetical protein